MNDQCNSVSAALATPELLAYIVGFLRDYKEDLKSCAEVSHAFSFPAQSHLFHTISLFRSPETSRVPEFLHEAKDDLGAATRLSDIMALAPNLRSLVRRVGAALDLHILTQLTNIGFTRLTHLTLASMSPSAIDLPVLSAAGDLLALPSLTTLVFDGGFCGMAALDHLFARCTPNLSTLDLRYVDVSPGPDLAPGQPRCSEKRARVTDLRILQPSPDFAKWLCDPRCPLDLSRLRHVDVFMAASPPLITVLTSARLTIVSLRLHSSDAVAGLNLACFPALSQLRIVGSPAELESALTRLEPDNNLAQITIASRIFDADPAALARIDAALAGLCMSALARVELSVLRPGASIDSIDETRAMLATVFSQLGRKGVLVVRDFREWSPISIPSS
ncbi:hypothetical protein DFH07DRAFT_503175 [Mycena maculata]|uniref:Uncharacterized protein n=1 Tax=Mycena maculata TaxID=230809 RepID=A0AAD7J1G8_9AGAR|nr:hypothetical protein DFH07DRAFT_503175 [Mycena maculata]